jgi:transposase-like protein
MAKRRSQSFKIQAVEKALNRSSHETLAHIADHYGIGYSTLTRWMLETKQGKLTEESMVARHKEKRPRDWTAGEKLQAIVDTERLNEQEKGRYCREKGLYHHQIDHWKDELTHMQNDTKTGKLTAENRALKAENKRLQKELARKEKALAEAAALMVLKKKAQALFGSGEED